MPRGTLSIVRAAKNPQETVRIFPRGEYCGSVRRHLYILRNYHENKNNLDEKLCAISGIGPKIAKKVMIESELSSMIRKVALVQALREAFPSDLGGMYDAAEVGEEVD